MRRIYHRFPTRIDLDFDIERPFIDVVSRIVALNGTNASRRVGEDLVRIDFLVSVTSKKIDFVPADEVPGLLDDLSEAVDFRIELKETTLTGERRIPRSRTVFLLRLKEEGMTCECFCVKEGTTGDLDAMDMRNFIAGATS